MKDLTHLKLFLLLIFSAPILQSDAQHREKCGLYTIDKAAFSKALHYEKNHATLVPAAPIVLRVFFQICEPDGGGFPDITETMLQTEIDHLEQVYGPDNICFLNGGFSFINSTALDTFNFSVDDRNLFNPYKVPHCITVFLIKHLGGLNSSNGGGASGITFGPLPTNWCIVEKDYINRGTTEHEIGHCFGLLHTFDYRNGNGLEDIDESNGTSSADLVADTYADPYVFANEKKSDCFSSTFGGCVYNGTCTDPKENSNYTPPYSNMMSYWCEGLYPTYTITNGQYVRINSFLNTSSVLQDCESQNTVIENSSVHNGIYVNSAVTTLTTNGSVVLDNAVNVTLGSGTTVLLEPGFHASPSSGGQVTIRIATCFSGAKAVKSPFEKYSITNNNLNKGKEIPGNKIYIFPNPATNLVNLKFMLEKNESDAEIDVYNINAQKLKSFLFRNLVAGNNLITLKLAGLPSGIYNVILHTSGELISVKLVVINN